MTVGAGHLFVDALDGIGIGVCGEKTTGMSHTSRSHLAASMPSRPPSRFTSIKTIWHILHCLQKGVLSSGVPTPEEIRGYSEKDRLGQPRPLKRDIHRSSASRPIVVMTLPT